MTTADIPAPASPRLAEHLEFVTHGTIPATWRSAPERLDRERRLVLAELEQPHRQAYGFSTLLGPLDDRPVTARDQQLVVEAHLVGRPEDLEGPLLRSITGAKLSQLANGGSGISRGCFEQLLDRAGRQGAVPIDLSASYSAADVVPAAWWTVGMLGSDHPWEPGDVIALINGNFVSTGVAAHALVRLVHAVRELFSTVGPWVRRPVTAPIEEQDPVGHLVASCLAGRDDWDTPPQWPVSLRDGGPALRLTTQTFQQLSAEVEYALARSSGNPLFEVEGSVQAHSQSSFLQPSLTASLVQAQHLVAYLSALLQRVTDTVSSRWVETSRDSMDEQLPHLDAVQRPKVSEAYRQQVARLIAAPDYSGSLSGGVEDLWDQSLMTARALLQGIDLLERQTDLLTGMSSHRLTAATGAADPAASPLSALTPAFVVRHLGRGTGCILGG